MPTPLGHSLVGLAIFAMSHNRGKKKPLPIRESVGWGGLCVVASNVPDLDFIYWGDKGLTLTARYHHGLTHSIGFAIMFGLTVSLWAWVRKFGSPKKVFLLTSVSIWLHGLMDLFGTDNYPLNGIGLPLLWPITDKYYVAPFMPGVSRINPLGQASLYALGIEFVFYGAILLMAIWPQLKGRWQNDL